MLRLASIIYALTGPTLAGTFVIVALVSGLDTMRPIVIAAAMGFAAAVPAAWLIAKRILETRR